MAILNKLLDIIMGYKFCTTDEFNKLIERMKQKSTDFFDSLIINTDVDKNGFIEIREVYYQFKKYVKLMKDTIKNWRV
jgi:outer membrane PBP1 activator LpoA protein